MQKGFLVNSTTDTLKKSTLRKRGQTVPGLVALYDIQLGNRAGLLLQPRSPHRASSGRVCVLLNYATGDCEAVLAVRRDCDE